VTASDGGMYEAINRGLAIVRGEIVGYINGDDEVTPRALEVVARAFADHPEAGWLCGRVEYIDGTGSILGRMKPVTMSVRSYVGMGWSCIPQQTVWFRRSFLDRVGRFDTSYSTLSYSSPTDSVAAPAPSERSVPTPFVISQVVLLPTSGSVGPVGPAENPDLGHVLPLHGKVWLRRSLMGATPSRVWNIARSETEPVRAPNGAAAIRVCTALE
jgi:hypothetical protein